MIAALVQLLAELLVPLGHRDQPNPTVANPYDPLTLLPSEYSLVDMNGAPVDGALAALTAKWLAFSAPIRLPSVTPTIKP